MTVPLHIKMPDARTPLLITRQMGNQEFENFCFDNPELVIEREADGTLKIMTPVSPISGDREAEFIADLKYYARKNGGKAYSSSTGFKLPDTSVKSPDACYVSAKQVAPFDSKELRHFVEIVPEFIVEVVSPSDTLSEVEDKMRNVWIRNGVRLAWLVDVDADKLWVYRADGSIELISPLDRIITGEDVLPGFEFDLRILT